MGLKVVGRVTELSLVLRHRQQCKYSGEPKGTATVSVRWYYYFCFPIMFTGRSAPGLGCRKFVQEYGDGSSQRWTLAVQLLPAGCPGLLSPGEPGSGAGGLAEGAAGGSLTSLPGPGPAASLSPPSSFLSLLPVGPCLCPRREPTACQERPQRSLGQPRVRLGRTGPSFVKL